MKTGCIDRRSGEDRRSNEAPGIKSLFIHRRRRKVRRKNDKYKLAYFDQYSTGILITIVSILLLSLVDALLTLFLLDCGASEINPVMAYYLRFGPYAFIGAKYIFTSFSLITLLVFSNYYIRKINIHVRSLFHYAAGLFALVIGWELFLVFQVIY